MWENYIDSFKTFLLVEKSLATNSVDAYLLDIAKLQQYLALTGGDVSPVQVNTNHIRKFLEYIQELNVSERSQARIISGIRAFYRFLAYEDLIEADPMEIIDTPRIPRTLPDILSIEEIDKIIECIDLSKNEGHRNRAIIETLYGCGLRVTELLELKISNLHFEEEYILVQGKGQKQRIVPISKKAIQEIQMYFSGMRNHLKVNEMYLDYVFLNRRGSKLTRMFIFMIIKELTATVGINKVVSPHTFRHTFASHLIEGGADLRAVQEMLGHESITTTEIYTHLNSKFLQETIKLYHPRGN